MATADETRERLIAALDACEERCARVGAVSDALRVRIATLRAVFEGGVSARVAAVGRRGSGKSTLLNALANGALAKVGDVADATMRASVERAGEGLIWLDTPGLRAGGRVGRLELVREVVAAFTPTVVLFTCPATEVDAGIDDDLTDLRAVVDAIPKEVPVVLVVTRVDELAPPDVLTPPFVDDDEKRSNIVRAVTTLRRHAVRHGVAPRVTLPVCAYATWGDVRDDARWNLDALTRSLRATRPRDVDADVQGLARGVAEEVIEHHAREAGAVAERAPSGRRRELLGGIHEAMVATLEGFVTAVTGRDGASEADAARGSVKPGGVTEALRGVLEGLGATRASAAVAAARVRTLGRSVLASEAWVLQRTVVEE